MGAPATVVNGLHVNGDNVPPPSTLAAQLVHNQTRHTVLHQQHNGAEPTFAQLLHEILNNSDAAQETDVRVNVSLISVVGEAGLTPLAQDNPFVDWDILIPQAKDSIAVIEKTIRRQPEVLLHPVKPDGPQLALPLLAQIVSACGRPKCQDLPFVRVLDGAIRSLTASPDLWRHAKTIQSVCQDLVDDFLSALDAPLSSTSPFSVKVPSASSVARLWPQAESAVALPIECQATIKQPAQAILAALLLSKVPSLEACWQHNATLRLQQVIFTHRKQLEASGQWQLVVQELLRRAGQVPILCRLFEEAGKVRESGELQQLMAGTLMRLFQCQVSDSVADDLLLPRLLAFANAEGFAEMHEDLRTATATWLCRFLPRDGLPSHVLALNAALEHDSDMIDGGLKTAFQELGFSAPASTSRCSRRKRRKLGGETNFQQPSTTMNQITKLLTGMEREDLTAIAEIAPDMYLRLSEEEQCMAWSALRELASSNHVVAFETATKLIVLPELQKAKKPRVLAMFALKACVQRSDESNVLKLETTEHGRFCLSALHSSLRELRIAAGQTLPAFLDDRIPYDIRESNRHTAVQYLRHLSDRDVACEHETLIPAWAAVGLVSGDRELNLVLLQLVNYLGHPNSLVCAVAFEEIDKLAAARQQTMQELFIPFLSSVAIAVVQDLLSRPQKAQALCELLKIDNDKFLTWTQTHTIPALVLGKRVDILQRIAIARGKQEQKHVAIEELVLQPKATLAATLAILLNQPATDMEEATLDCLGSVAQGFRGIDLAALVKLEPVLTACEMLKLSGDTQQNRKSRAYHAIQAFANLAERAPGQQRARSRSMHVMTDFFDTHILGIMAHFSHVLTDVQSQYLVAEKLRCVRAIHDMIMLAKEHTSVALPQIKSCLLSAMDHRRLQEAAFVSWLALLTLLEAEEGVRMLDQTFVLVIEHWSDLSTEVQQKTHSELTKFVQTNSKIINENIMTMPSVKDIPVLSKLASEIDQLRSLESIESHFRGYEIRLRNEHTMVIRQALLELIPFLADNQEFIHDSAVSDQPTPILSALLRALLDVTTSLATTDDGIADLCGQAIGIIGCIDPNKIEAPKKKDQLLVLSNFDRESETVDWVMVMLEQVLVKAFKSNTNARAQGFLAWVIQELLKFGGLNSANALRSRSSQASTVVSQWAGMPEHVRITLTPFLRSRYHITSISQDRPDRKYPSFQVEGGHNSWLRGLVLDLLSKAKGDNPKQIFPLLTRVIRGHDIAISTFLLPYTMTNVVLGGTVAEVSGIGQELLAVLECRPTIAPEQDTVKQCSETVFEVLDYMSSWLQEKKKVLAQTRAEAYRTGISPENFDEAKDMGQIEEMERFLGAIPAETLAARAMECGQYARALFNWEQYIRSKRPVIPAARMSQEEEVTYGRLHSIYAAIDEPDGLEGIGAHLSFLTEEQQAVQHTKAGRWTAAQAWYELQLAKQPSDNDIQASLLNCLRETGQYAPLLRYAQTLLQQASSAPQSFIEQRGVLPVTLEAHWMTGDIAGLRQRAEALEQTAGFSFDLGLSKVLLAAQDQDEEAFATGLSRLRASVAQAMTEAGTSSLQACHDDLRKLHTLYELQAICSPADQSATTFLERAGKRLAALGSYQSDKQYILGFRRAAMRINKDTFGDAEVGTSWLATARLARKAGNTHSAYNAVLEAYHCGDRGAKLEEARLLWHDGHQRQAIQALEAAIASGVFENADVEMADVTNSRERSTKQNMLSARAHLLLAKWLDASGQTQSKDMTLRYQYAAKNFQRWEKGHYYLGKHYGKLLAAEKALPKHKQTTPYLGGEVTKSVVENLMRSIPFGNKYWHETIPKVLTLWLDLGMETLTKSRSEDQTIYERRVKSLQVIQKQLQKYCERIPPYVFYSALPQLISRIAHPHLDVWKQLSAMVTRIIAAHPSQALWCLFPVVRATDHKRAERGTEIMNRLKNPSAKLKTDGSDLKSLILHGQKLAEGLLDACEGHIEPRKSHVSLHKDLKFNMKLAPSNLVVPVEASLTPTVPMNADSERIRRHKGFVQEKVIIQSFQDDVLVLNSLQRPRKITLRGSDGKLYGLLCKPKDDLRKDQRLMEFNGIINRALQRDAGSSKRRLYIKTYAVTPLSEESGTIEWVEGIKPIRDILLQSYARKAIRPNYNQIRSDLDQACKEPENVHLYFNERVLTQFPPALHEWFTETYSEPETWFAARLRYARSAAVMSMTGHVLGLGDRHGENILLEESTGGVFHVDFNCLFDKGLTFEKPELVPFRLTHNMVDAMGAYGYEGPFRKSSELTLGLLRQNRDTLMTVLETFLYDPTTDFVGKKKRSTAGVPETPQEILDSVGNKLGGYLRGENVPLGVEGYVDALIREAVSPNNLAAMYIGWCAFL
ncbi:Domain in UVSB PI-3 kinase, MEI-41 and ESR-1 [Teratosphaeria destructans]|uniref:non-specific serine/threonine protein kinase n=1 Tax=Teratosphaeria destructans TaxID=418781 RepID=A0A9W7T1C8_9PEZI|nr:Domain in UVSB PI-3 kinase, MEI-41 and ESR-1 [Teratosphaeria destructans]